MQRRLFLFSPVLLAQDAIRVEVNLVNVPFNVLDSRGQLVQNLSADDFEVFEDGSPQKIAFFSRAADSPLTLAVIADVSGSQQEFLKDHRRDLRDFLKTALTPRDQAMLICFGNSIRLVSPLSSKPEHLDDALKDFQKARNISQFPKIGAPELRTGGSAFHDAVVAAAQELEGLEGRRAILLFSDGEDTSSAHHLLDSIEAAQQHSATVFCLRYTDVQKRIWNSRNKYGRSVMRRLALETGGLEFDAAEEDNLRAAFRQIADTLRSSYDLAYNSANPDRDNAFRKIRIRPRRDGLQTRHKTGYYARPL